MKKTLEIKTATVEIKVVRVDGHKMTMTTFKQLPTLNILDTYNDIFFKRVDDFDGYHELEIVQNSDLHRQMSFMDCVLGWVKTNNGIWILCVEDGVLGKEGVYCNYKTLITKTFDQLYIAT